MEVKFPEAYDVRFPDKCACCMKDTTDKRVSFRHTIDFGFGDPKARTKKLQIPYCRACRDHVDWQKGGGYLGVVLSIPVNGLLAGGLVALLVFLWRMTSTWAYDHETLTGGVGIAAVIAIVGLLTHRRLAKRPSGAGGGHARAGESVEITGFKSRGTVTIRIHNPEWARLFSDANPALFPAR